MIKEKTTGKIGEKLVKDLLLKNKIKFIDMILAEKEIIVEIPSINVTYTKKVKSHPFDILVKDKKVEIKTSKINNKIVNACFAKNNIKIIDYLILLVLDNNNNFLYCHLLNNKQLKKSDSSYYKGIRYNVNRCSLKKLNSKELIDILKKL